MYMWTYTNGAIAATVWGSTDVQSAGYQEAGNWVGVLFAVQDHRISHLGCDITIVQGPQTGLCPEPRTGWHRFHIHPVLPQRISAVHLLSADRLCLGRHACHAVHYPDQFGFGQNMGAYLGLFNGTICVPQIAAALVGGGLLHLVGGIR